MSLPRLVALCGHARAGKDTAALYLEARYGYARYSLAAPLKAAVCDLFGWDAADLERIKDDIDPRYGLSPRQALQALGTEYAQRSLCRLFPVFAMTTGRGLWVKRLLERSVGESLVVVSDCRFPHEEEAIHAAGGVVIRIHRPGLPVDLSHESERSVAHVHEDALAVNGGSIEDLERELDTIMHDLGGLAAPEEPA